MKRYIKSNSTQDDVFMFMDYYADIGPDTNGMDGDDFSCLGKFFAKDLATAKREFETLKQKYPWLKKDYRSTKYSVHSYYVDNYNEYFDRFPDSEDDIDMNPSAWGGAEYNVFPDLETLIKYLGLDKEPYTGDYDEDDELPFTI